MQAATQGVPALASNKKLWVGRVMSGLVIALLLMDSVMKFLRPAAVIEGTVKLGYSTASIVPLGVVLLVCVLAYAIPRTSVLGAILLTGYLVVQSRPTCGWAILCFRTSCSLSTSASSCGLDFTCAMCGCRHCFLLSTDTLLAAVRLRSKER